MTRTGTQTGTSNKDGPGKSLPLAFLLAVVFLDVISLGVTLPVLPKLVVSLGGRGENAAVYGVFVAAWQVAHLLAAPTLGALSDRYGRRPLILVSCFGLGLDYLLMATATTLPMLMLGRLISGVTAATFSIAAAYVADTTPPEGRPQRYALLGATFSTGFVLGPALGGILGRVDIRLPFWIAGGFTLLTAVLGTFVLPESLPKDRRSAMTLSKLNPIGALRSLAATPRLRWLTAVAFFYFSAQYVFQSVYALYVGRRYGWVELDIGLALAFSSLVGAVVQTALSRRLSKRFGERRLLLFALASGLVAFAIVGTATTGMVSLLSVPFGAFGGLARAALQSGMSREVPSSEQGRLHGALVCVSGIAGSLAPTGFTTAYSWGQAHAMLGIPFYLAVLVGGIATWCAAFVPEPKG